MKVAYADPPYFGCCKMYGHNHPDGRCWDEEETHAALIRRLCEEFPEGWALSGGANSLPMLLRHCEGEGVRVGIWTKPFASFKPNVTPAYAWEPVIFTGGRPRSRDEWSGRDWVSVMPPVFSGEAGGVPGMKPETFCYWVFNDLLGLRAGDELVDLYAGSGAVATAWERYQRQGRLFACSDEPSKAVLSKEPMTRKAGMMESGGVLGRFLGRRDPDPPSREGEEDQQPPGGGR
jgi:hypothetical protein